MSLQAQIKAWLEEVKTLLADLPSDQTWVSIPLLQSWLSCSYSQALMVRDAMIKEEIIQADAVGNQYPLTAAYVKAPTPEAQPIQPTTEASNEPAVEATPEKPKRKTTRSGSKKQSAPRLTTDRLILYALAFSDMERALLNQIIIRESIPSPLHDGRTREALSTDETEILCGLLRLSCQGLISREGEIFSLAINRKDASTLIDLCDILENPFARDLTFVKNILKYLTLSTEEVKAFISDYDQAGMTACGDSISRVSWEKFENFKQLRERFSAPEATEDKPQETAEETVEEVVEETVEEVEEVAVEEATPVTEQPAEAPTEPKPKPQPQRKPAPPQQNVDAYTEEQLTKYANPATVELFCTHIWQNMLLHLCVKGFNDITAKYLPTLAEKHILPPSVEAYLSAHPITQDTPCLPLSGADLQASLQDFGLFALIELLKENPDITRGDAKNIITDRVRGLRNMYILSPVAIDSYQAVRNTLINSSDEAFENFKKRLS